MNNEITIYKIIAMGTGKTCLSYAKNQFEDLPEGKTRLSRNRNQVVGHIVEASSSLISSTLVYHAYLLRLSRPFCNTRETF